MDHLVADICFCQWTNHCSFGPRQHLQITCSAQPTVQYPNIHFTVIKRILCYSNIVCPQHLQTTTSKIPTSHLPIQNASAENWSGSRRLTRLQWNARRVTRSSRTARWVVRNKPTGSLNTRQEDTKTMTGSLLNWLRTLKHWESAFPWFVRTVLLLLYHKYVESIMMCFYSFIHCYFHWQQIMAANTVHKDGFWWTQCVTTLLRLTMLNINHGKKPETSVGSMEVTLQS